MKTEEQHINSSSNEQIYIKTNYKRLEYVDIARGIAIILMVVGHVISVGWKRNFIFSFHMPLFIIISGMFHKKRSFKETSINILKKLILPYIICAFITDVIICKFNITNIFNMWIKQILFSYTFWNKLTFDSDIIALGPLWFFPLLGLIKMVFYIQKKIAKENDFSLFLSCIFLMYIGYLMGIKGYWLPFSFDVVLVSVIFYFVGYIITKRDLIKKIINNKQILFLSLIIWIIGIKYNSIELAIRNYNDMLFSTLTALCGSLIILKISHIISTKTKITKKVLMWYGKNSMYVLLLHYIENALIPYREILRNIENETLLKMLISAWKILEITITIFAINYIKKLKINKKMLSNKQTGIHKQLN